MGDNVPFLGRIACLLLFAAVMSFLDFRKRGNQATQYLEYGFVLAAGLVGALIGAGNDFITSSISPDYFTIGKGLTDGGRISFNAVQYGLQVGCSGGVISGAIAVYLTRRKSAYPPIGFGALFSHLWMPVSGALLGAVALPAIASRFDPMGFAAQLRDVLTPDRIARFRLVWWIHLGVYLGLAMGLAAMLTILLRRRRMAARAGWKSTR